MKPKVHKFRLPKAGNRLEEYEDAHAIGTRSLNGTSIWRGAVADGATESPYSGAWAKQLVTAFRDGRFDNGITEDSLAPLRSRWKEQLVPTENLPWYLEEKLSQGSYAALAGLTLTSQSPRKGVAKLIAVGDCCIIQVRNHRAMRSFPLERSADFNSRPHLLGTNEGSLTNGVVCVKEWQWRTHDTFFLMSDALAAWYLKAWESHTDHRKSVFADIDMSYLEWKQWFTNILADERRDCNLKNDDITLLAVHMEG